MGSSPSKLAKAFGQLVEKEDVDLSKWQPLLAQLPTPRQPEALPQDAGSCLCAADHDDTHPDILAASNGYFISLSPDYRARKLTAALVEAGVPFPRKILAHQHSTQFRRAMDYVVGFITHGEVDKIRRLVHLGFPATCEVDLAAAADVAADAARLPPAEATSLIRSAEGRFPLPPLLAALQQSSASNMGSVLRVLQAHDPTALLQWVPVTGRPLPSALLGLPPDQLVGRPAQHTYMRWAVLQHSTPLFAVTPFHTMFHNTFQPQQLFDAAALLPRAGGTAGALDAAQQAPRESSLAMFNRLHGVSSDEHTNDGQEALRSYLAAAADPSLVPSGVSPPAHTAAPPLQLPLINALDAFGNSVLCHAVLWALEQLRRAAASAADAWRADRAAKVGPCGGHAHLQQRCAQCSTAAAMRGAMWMTWRHCAEAVFRTLLGLGADSTRPQHVELRRRRDVSWAPVPLVDMLIAQWHLPSVRHLPSAYTRVSTLPVDFAGSVRGRNLVAAREWERRDTIAAARGVHIDDGTHDQRRAAGHLTEDAVPSDLRGGAAQCEVGGNNEHLLQPEHEHLLQWLVGAASGLEGELPVLHQRQMTGARAPQTVFRAIKDLREAMAQHTQRKVENAARKQNAVGVQLGSKVYPGCLDDPQVQMYGSGVNAAKPHVAFLLERLLELGAVPSVAAGRMLYFYAEALPAALGGVLWFRRRLAVLARRQTRDARRKAAAP